MLVLLVDDEAFVRRVLRVVLEADEFDVLEASTAEEAIALAASSQPDVIVCDLMLQGTPGDVVCRTVKDSGSKARVLVLTSLPADEAADHALQAGADDVMVKPFSALALLEKIHKLGSDA